MEYVIGIIVLCVFGYFVYNSATNTADTVVGDAPVETPKPTNLSKARLTALTKAQLVEKGNELGVKVNPREVKSKIVNQVYKAQ